MLAVVVSLSLCFGLANGVHDAGNAIAAPIATRAMTPRAAVALASVFHFVGALVVGTAVAATVAGIVAVPRAEVLGVLGAALCGALIWNLATLRMGLPCSSGHCLVGSLTGAALAQGGFSAVHWGGLHGVRPVGVLGSLVWLVATTVVAVPLSWTGIRLARRTLRRASKAISRSIGRGEVVTTAALAFAHGSNDAQKTMGLVAFALVASGHLARFSVPLWVVLASAGTLTLGTSLGGWRVVRTLGRGIYRLRSLEGLVSQGSAALVVLAGSLLGAPISTTDVVAPAVVGVGAGGHWRHVRWRLVGEIGLAWLVTLPISAALAALALPAWRALG
jgi:inorganic phosphate transporter, PiT family